MNYSLLFFLSLVKLFNYRNGFCMKEVKERNNKIEKKHNSEDYFYDINKNRNESGNLKKTREEKSFIEKILNRINVNQFFYILNVSYLNKEKRKRIKNKIEEFINYMKIENFIYFLDMIKKRKKKIDFITRNINKMRIDQLEWILNNIFLEEELKENIKHEIKYVEDLIEKRKKEIKKSKDKISIFYSTPKEIDWIRRMRENDFIDVTEIRTMNLNSYALELLMKLKIKRVDEFNIVCSDENKIQWIEQMSKMLQIREIKKLVLKNYSLKVLIKLNIEKIDELEASCENKDSVIWIEKSKAIKIKKIRKIFLYGYASKILMKLNTEKIYNLIVYNENEEEIEWVKKMYKMLQIKEIKKIILKEYASIILMKLKLKRIEELRVSCETEDQLDWIRNVEMLQIEDLGNLYLFGFSIEILKVFKSEIVSNVISRTILTFKPEKLKDWVEKKGDVFFTKEQKEQIKKNIKEIEENNFLDFKRSKKLFFDLDVPFLNV